MIGIGWLLDQATDWVLGSVRNTLNLIWKILASSLFHLPDVTGLPQVLALAERSLAVVNAGYILAITAAALATMTHGSVQIRYTASELLPRLVIGLVAANFATPLCTKLIQTANALVLAMTGQGISSDLTSKMLSALIIQLYDPVAALLTAVIGLILVVLVLMLVTGWISRFVILIVLCGTAPLALACHGTPWTEAVAQLWWRAMGGICLTVVLQALALNTTLSIFLDPDANLDPLGLPYDASGVFNLLMIAVLLGVTARIPSLVRRYLSQNNRQNIVGALVRLVVAQQVTRGIGRAIGVRTLFGLGRAGRGGNGRGIP